MNVLISDANIVGYKVNVAITFALEDSAQSDELSRAQRARNPRTRAETVIWTGVL